MTSTITGNHLALISFVRYHLAKKTEKCKAENLPLIVGLSIATYAIEYVSDVILVMLGQYDLHQLTCMDSMDHISPAAPVIAIVKGVIILLVGIFFDGCMIIFLKKRNKIGGGQAIGKYLSHVMLMKIMPLHYLLFFTETELVPWKSTSEEEFDYKIPVSATLVSAAGIVIVGPIASTFIHGTDSYIQTVLMNINPNLILPIMLLLTIRVRMEKKPAPQVPTGLMFYENGIQQELQYVQARGPKQGYQIPQGLQYHEGNHHNRDHEVNDQDQNLDIVQAGPSLDQDQHGNILVNAQVHSESRIVPQERSRVIHVQPCKSSLDENDAVVKVENESFGNEDLDDNDGSYNQDNFQEKNCVIDEVQDKD